MAFLDNTAIGNRLKEIRGKASARAFAMDATVDPSQYKKIENGKLPITENILNKLIERYRLDKDFILYGTDNQQFGKTIPQKSSYTEQRRNQKLSEDIFLVPYVDIPAQAGYKKAYDHIDYIQTLKKYPILPNVDPLGAIWRYFQIEGDSMENPNPKENEDEGFKSGDVILTSQVPREDWNDIKDYHTHVIVTETDLWIKDIFKESNDEWILLSANVNYDPFPIKVQDIRQLWVMRRHVKNRAKKHRRYNIDEIRKQLKK